MADPVGKTIKRIEEADEDRLLIHFTDGTALSVSGSSYEEVSLSYGMLDSAEVRRHQREQQGRREQERVRRLNRAGWMALSCEERAAKRPKDDGNWILPLYLEDAIIEDFNRSFGTRTTLRKRCVKCGERECPNAETYEVPPRKGPVFVAGTITIPSVGGA